MIRERHTASIPPSLLDRLLDDSPHNQVETTISRFDLRLFKQGIARDIEALLNTRLGFDDEVFERYPLARRSMINFGILDISAISLLDPDDRAYLRDKVREAIERHEPRLARVRVALEVPREQERQLHFRVDAVLRVHPNRPPISFDATLQLSSRAYQVRDQL